MNLGFGKKAAPRFELGIKDLQSSALPLGHAAQQVLKPTPLDRISQKYKNVLVLSNGHGEDLIALKILEALHKLHPKLKLEVLPLVGEGKAFETAIKQRWLVQLGIPKRLPSGGFSNQSFLGLISDIFSGLFVVSWKNWRCVKKASRQGIFILAVGDLLPLFFAWSSGSAFGFIGTPKSDYTWKTAFGSSLSDYYHLLKGTEWDPWEWYLMQDARCKLVAVRDQLTARGLRRKSVRALAPGNPMRDGFDFTECPESLKNTRRLLLLCGSRMPEAKINLQRLLVAAEKIKTDQLLTLFVVIGSEPSLNEISFTLSHLGFQRAQHLHNDFAYDYFFVKQKLQVFIGKHQFQKWSSFSEIGLANAGTATEQLVGLGVPCLSLPGKGPQFKYCFAKRQSRLLGGSVIPCRSQQTLAKVASLMLTDDSIRYELASIGKQRMGMPGGSENLANLILNVLGV